MALRVVRSTTLHVDGLLAVPAIEEDPFLYSENVSRGPQGRLKAPQELQSAGFSVEVEVAFKGAPDR